MTNVFGEVIIIFVCFPESLLTLDVEVNIKVPLSFLFCEYKIKNFACIFKKEKKSKNLSANVSKTKMRK